MSRRLRRSRLFRSGWLPLWGAESYIISKEGSEVYAKNGDAGTVEFSGRDDSRVIQRAIDAAYDSDGGTVLLRNGRYRLTSPLTVKCNFIGESLRTGIDNEMHGVVFTAAMESGIPISIGLDALDRQLKNLVVGNFGLQGNPQTPGLQIRQVVESTFFNIRVQGCTGAGKYGLTVGDGRSICILNSFYGVESKYNSNGVLLDDDGTGIVNHNYFVMGGFSNNAERGAKVEAGALHNIFDSCDFEHCDVGVSEGGTASVYLHPYLEVCRVGIRFGEDNAISTSPYILNPFMAGVATPFEYVRPTPPSVQLPKIYMDGHYFLRGRVSVPRGSASVRVDFPSGVWLYEYYGHPNIDENYVVVVNTGWQTGWHITRSPYGTGFTVYFSAPPASDTHLSYSVIPTW